VQVPAGVPGNGRAWELVTSSTEVNSTEPALVMAVSADGNKAVVFTIGALPADPEGTGITYRLAERGADGWTSTPLLFPDAEALLGSELDFVFQGPRAYSPDLSSSLWTNRLRPAPGETRGGVGLFRRSPGGEYVQLADMGGGQFVGASEDLSRAFFRTSSHLLPSDSTRLEGDSAYEVAGSTLNQLDLDSTGQLLSTCGTTIPSAPGAISTDGLRVFLLSAGPDCASGLQHAYLREGGLTTEISSSQCTRADCGEEQSVEFAGAAADGSLALLLTAQQLTDDDVDAGRDLYRYDVASGQLSRLSAPQVATNQEGGAASVAGFSADGSRVYFRDARGLLPGAGAGFYLADAAGLHFVANGSPERVSVSRNGRFAVFESGEALVPADTDGVADFYWFDAVDGDLAPIAPSEGAFVDAVTDGGRAIFTTKAALLAADRNEGIDVYEWTDGRPDLISPGVGDRVTFVGATADAGTVFFTASATLVPRDVDGGDVDIYAARVGGGYDETDSSGGCEGEACRAPPTPSAERRSPHSSSRPMTIVVGRTGAAARRRMARTKAILLALEVPAAGRLSATADARIGGRRRTVAATSLDAEQAGPVHLRLPLSTAARRILESGRSLRVRLALRLAGPVRASRRLSIVLEGAR
jgi:hypothetical protein